MELQTLSKRDDVVISSPDDGDGGGDAEICCTLVTKFGESTTCHGLPNILGGGSALPRRLVWLAVFLTAMGVFAFQAYELVKMFLAYDVRVNIEIGTAPSLTFPAVTICNTNKLRLSAIEGSRHSELAKTDPEHPDSIHRLLSYDLPCLPGDYQCADGQRCIKQHLRCDGYFHCWDGFSDETDCIYPPCGRDEFNCGQAGFHGICIPEEKRCDGIRHCFGGEDEKDCPVCTGGHACDPALEGRGYKCIPLDSMCDRFPDCADGTDEGRCDFLDGCEFPRLVVEATPSILYSTNYPHEYDNDGSCVVNLTVSGMSHDPWDWNGGWGDRPRDCVLLSFLELDIEASESCENDYIEIRDVQNPNITVRHCGSKIPPSWVSSSRDVMVKFVSNDRITGRGYRIEYSPTSCSSSNYWNVSPWSECSRTCGGGVRERQVECATADATPDASSEARARSEDEVDSYPFPPPPPPSFTDPNYGVDWTDVGGSRDTVCIAPGSLPATSEPCKAEFCPGEEQCNMFLTECCMEIKSPGYPLDYPPDVDCAVRILNADGCIALTIHDIDMPDSDRCHKDYLEYEEIRQSEEVYQRRFCGQQSGLRMMSSSAMISLMFHSDSVISGKGFRASYEFVACGTWFMSPWSECTVTCGYGQRVRQVHCISRSENTVIEDKFCEGDKPDSQKQCDQICSAPGPPGQMLDTLNFLYGNHKHICDDLNVYRDFLNNYYKPNNFDRVDVSPYPNWKGFLAFSSSPDYSDLQKVLDLSKEEVAMFGHQAEDFILQCSFDEMYCDYGNFSAFENDYYGNCFTFNSGHVNNQSLLMSNRPGSRYGLKLTLFIEQNEYIPLYGQEAGVRVLIHSPDVTPFPEDDGITVAPGSKTSIGLRMDTVEGLSEPYTNCTNQEEFDSIYGQGYRYSDLDCMKTKIQQYIEEECGCVDTMYMSGIPCDITDYEEEMCRQLMEFFYQRGLLSNDCKEPCKEVKYSKTMSQSQWPSNSHVGGLIKVLRPLNTKVRDHVFDEKSARDNLIRLNVYYDELNYQKITKLPAYRIEELLADIGGILGLYIGMSLITAVEIIQFLVDLVRYFAFRSRDTKQNRTPSHI